MRPGTLGSTHYGDLFVDWMSEDGRWMVGAGYGTTALLDVDRWDTMHSGMLRVTWNERKRRGREP